MLGNVAQSKEVLKRAVHSAIACQSHEMDALASLLGIGKSVHNLGIAENRLISNSLIDLHEILIHDTPTTYVEVSHLAVTHLAVGQSHVLAACLQLAVRIGL